MSWLPAEKTAQAPSAARTARTSRPSVSRLLEVLEPAAGEQVLEVGAGTGYYSFAVAAAVGPRGRLWALDSQPEMLAHLERKAAERGIENLVPVPAAAERLPFEDGSFDAACMAMVMGDLSDPEATLARRRRLAFIAGWER